MKLCVLAIWDTRITLQEERITIEEDILGEFHCKRGRYNDLQQKKFPLSFKSGSHRSQRKKDYSILDAEESITAIES